MVTTDRPKAIVFDMDGLLLDSTPMLVAAYRATVETLTGHVMTEDELFTIWHHGTMHGTLAALIGREPSAEDIAMHLDNVEAALPILRAYDGIPEAVARVSTSVPVAVFTASSRAYALKCLHAVGLSEFFPETVLIASEDVAHPKPSGDGLRIAAKHFDVAPDAIAYIGDALNDMLAARDAGSLAVAGRWGHYFAEDLPFDVAYDTPAGLLALLPA